MVKNRTLVPVIRSPPYSGIRSVIPSQVAESPRYNGQSRPSSDNWLHIHLIQAAAGPADDNKRDDNKRKPNTCSWRHTKIVSCRFQLSTTVNKNTGFLCNLGRDRFASSRREISSAGSRIVAHETIDQTETGTRWLTMFTFLRLQLKYKNG